jgi:hypothetical protein
MWDDFVISKKFFKANNRPMGENSPNLVTLGITPVSHHLMPAAGCRDQGYKGGTLI